MWIVSRVRDRVKVRVRVRVRVRFRVRVRVFGEMWIALLRGSVSVVLVLL